jgi:hypothetical protein
VCDATFVFFLDQGTPPLVEISPAVASGSFEHANEHTDLPIKRCDLEGLALQNKAQKAREILHVGTMGTFQEDSPSRNLRSKTLQDLWASKKHIPVELQHAFPNFTNGVVDQNVFYEVPPAWAKRVDYLDLHGSLDKLQNNQSTAQDRMDLERLRGKVLMLYGDSTDDNVWSESFHCARDLTHVNVRMVGGLSLSNDDKICYGKLCEKTIPLSTSRSTSSAESMLCTRMEISRSSVPWGPNIATATF